MRFLFYIVLFFSAISAGAQTPVPARCPAISIAGPAGLVPSGRSVAFTASVTSTDPEFAPQIRWNISGGQLVSGQGTREIQVKFLGRAINVELVIHGLPSGCPGTAEESYPHGQPQEVAVKMGEVATEDVTAINTEIARVMVEMKDFRDDRLYILMGIQNGWEKSDAERVEKTVIDALSGPSGREIMHYSRITLAPCGNKDLPATIWRVPQGASNPNCNTQDSVFSEGLGIRLTRPNCPRIEVIGPPGVIEPGESIEFSAKLDGELPPDLILTWTTSQGAILGGQGTTKVKVSTDPKFAGTTTTVTLKLLNLPPGCPSEAYETMPLIWEPLVTLLNEVTGEAWKLPSFPASEILIKFRDEPSARLLIIGYFPKSTLQRTKDDAKKRMVAKIVSKRILSRDQINFVDGGEDPAGLLTFRFYKVPEGADRPNP